MQPKSVTHPNASPTLDVLFQRCLSRQPDALALLSALRPDLHVKGTDYTEESVPERDLVARLGGRTAIAGDGKEHSTTDVIARIRELS